MDTTHLDALLTRLSHEHGYLSRAKTDGERALRSVWISQIEKEIEYEYRHLGIGPMEDMDMTDDELLSELAP